MLLELFFIHCTLQSFQNFAASLIKNIKKSNQIKQNRLADLFRELKSLAEVFVRKSSSNCKA